MNKLGFGFLRLPMKNGHVDLEKVNELVDCFMENGGNYFDTCYTYLNGESEAAVRECVVKRKARSSFQLAEKLPGYMCRSYEDCQKYFDQEQVRCGVDYFDVFMLHWLNGENYRTAEKYDEFRFLQEKKEEGKALRIGFSYHDNADLLDEILTRHPEVDLVLLQINYLDWDSAGIESGRCYETCVKHGKKVMVMEPVKGGTLARIPEEADRILRASHADWTPADWALRFAQSLPEVEIVLSGMNELEQVRRNLLDAEPLTEKDIGTLLSIRPFIIGDTAVPCTGCRYCVPHCPKDIAIPDYFRLYNEISRYPEDGWKIEPSYRHLAARKGRASDCITCRRCESYCPQKISIADQMERVARAFF